MRRRLIAGVLLSCCACQAYTPITVTPATATQDVRVTLTDAGAALTAGALGSGAMVIEGRLQSVTDSTLSLAVTQVTRAGGDDEARSGESVTLARSNIASVEQKRTAVGRSLLAAGVIVGGALLVAKSIGGSEQIGLPREGGGQQGQQ